MRRKKQQLSHEECVMLLKTEKRGVLSLLGDEGYPYGIPLDFYYEDGKIYFHGAKEGHKISAVENCDKASFCVFTVEPPKDGGWINTVKSVIAFGRIHKVENLDKTIEICRKLSKKFTDDSDYTEKEIAGGKDRVLCLELVCEHITGKKTEEK